MDKIPDKEDYIELRDQIYKNRIDLTGRVLKSGTKIGKMLVDGRDKEDTIIYKGIEKNGKHVIIKYTYNYNDIINGIKHMKNLEKLGIEFYYYHVDKLLDIIDESDNFIVMEKLLPVKKDDVLEMLKQLIPVIFKYKGYMAHCDIKPDNIMKSSSGKFYFIDYDSVCNIKFLYGYKRSAFTPKFATQSDVFNPILITIKQDLIELILSAHAIYYGDDKREIQEKDNYRLFLVQSLSELKYTSKRIFGALYIITLNMNEKYIIDNDLYLLLITLKAIHDNNNPELIDKILSSIEKGLDNKDIIITPQDLIPPVYPDDDDDI